MSHHVPPDHSQAIKSTITILAAVSNWTCHMWWEPATGLIPCYSTMLTMLRLSYWWDEIDSSMEIPWDSSCCLTWAKAVLSLHNRRTCWEKLPQSKAEVLALAAWCGIDASQTEVDEKDATMCNSHSCHSCHSCHGTAMPKSRCPTDSSLSTCKLGKWTSFWPSC